jgi:hypothetical protein
MPALQQPLGHVGAHTAETDYADFHKRSSFLLKNWFKTFKPFNRSARFKPFSEVLTSPRTRGSEEGVGRFERLERFEHFE